MQAIHNSLRACERKRKHPTQHSAKMAVRAMVLNGSAKPGLHPYYCENCSRKFGRAVYHTGCSTRWCR